MKRLSRMNTTQDPLSTPSTLPDTSVPPPRINNPYRVNAPSGALNPIAARAYGNQMAKSNVPGTSEIEAAAQVAGSAGDYSNSQTTNNSSADIDNAYQGTMNGLSGRWNNMSMTAAAERTADQQALGNVNNRITAMKSVLGPAGTLLGAALRHTPASWGLGISDAFQQQKFRSQINRNTVYNNEGRLVDPRMSVTSSYRNKNFSEIHSADSERPQQQVSQGDPAVHNTLTYDYDSKKLNQNSQNITGDGPSFELEPNPVDTSKSPSILEQHLKEISRPVQKPPVGQAQDLTQTPTQ